MAQATMAAGVIMAVVVIVHTVVVAMMVKMQGISVVGADGSGSKAQNQKKKKKKKKVDIKKEVSVHDDTSSDEDEELIGMVQKNELQSNPSMWMLDSGSSTHAVDEQAEADAVMMMAVNADANPLMRWHERFGHLNVAAIKHMMETGKVSGMDIPKELLKKKFTCLSYEGSRYK
ncbi:hypothetical protein PHYSODRAFT_256278 [Phytophthora sojae]|uniref:GAG-pre-integrase domain-containing protein n=1 Tax=Phytophthora sojae (strain P6497) TaxID=1094619 RepID=G4Z5P5_PHYSP|nr:hypothetical protein PHYSODRAFT_256278 [Phytophthora sojae]EGZ22359.1 hypothetical protein PHYSODRAFT_256278 [Phytophthora sojae]|eukprot:XP_009525076.1 hypothetical protein PHYSODRAFT_256278 [Phytophthora sojae]